MLLSAIPLGHYIGFTGTYVVELPDNIYLRIPFIPGSILGSVLVGFFPNVGKRRKILSADGDMVE